MWVCVAQHANEVHEGGTLREAQQSIKASAMSIALSSIHRTNGLYRLVYATKYRTVGCSHFQLPPCPRRLRRERHHSFEWLCLHCVRSIEKRHSYG